MLRVDAIDVYYGEFQALEGVCLEVQERETVIVVGPNGAGKSTLLRGISGLQKVRKGTIYFQDERIDNVPAYKIVERGVSLVPEGGRVFPYLSVEDNLKAGSYNRTARNHVKQSFEQTYGLFPILAQRRRQMAGSLSGGERQMLAIARSLMSRPKLILLDEPSLGLAPLVVDLVFDLVKKMKQEGYSILLVEQNAKKALQLADHAYLVESGKLVFDGKRDDFDKNPYIKTVYLGL
jgi:branched-chain amino acid transport system ATP-binding protein